MYAPLWIKYPDYIFYTSERVKTLIGGSVDAAGIKNTCAVRLSRTLNENGIRLPYSKTMERPSTKRH